MTDDWNPDDYEAAQGIYLWTPEDVEWAGDYALLADDEFRDDDDEPLQESDDPHGGHTGMVLRFDAVCASCSQEIPAGTYAVSVGTEQGWLRYHEQHAAAAQLVATAVVAPPSIGAPLWPGERAFRARFIQPCVVCGKDVVAGDDAAGRRIETAWLLRHRGCGRPS